MIALCAVISGADSFAEIELFATTKEKWLKTFIDLENGIPSHDTLARVFSILDPETLGTAFRRWVTELATLSGGEVVAIDGKSLRRSFRTAGSNSFVHMVSAWATSNRVVFNGAIRGENVKAVFRVQADMPLVNRPPIAAAGPDQSFRLLACDADGTPVRLDATGSTDPDGNIRSYRWDLGQFTLATGASAIVPLLPPGEYDITLVVTDSFGGRSTDQVKVTVASLPDRPELCVRVNRGLPTVFMPGRHEAIFPLSVHGENFWKLCNTNLRVLFNAASSCSFPPRSPRSPNAGDTSFCENHPEHDKCN